MCCFFPKEKSLCSAVLAAVKSFVSRLTERKAGLSSRCRGWWWSEELHVRLLTHVCLCMRVSLPVRLSLRLTDVSDSE